MTTHRLVTAGALAYDFAPDDAPLVAHRDWAIASAQLLDDIARTPITAPFRARIVLPGPQEEISQTGARVSRVERNITLKTGADGTFALVARPWLRFTPFSPAPIRVTVAIDAQGFAPLSITFPIAYDTRTIAAPAPGIGDRLVTLNTTAGLVLGQTLLFGPEVAPQYVRIAAIGAANQITLAAGVITPQNLGDPVFPDTFTSPPPLITTLRREAVPIVGCVVRRNTSTNLSTNVANALVTVTDFWRTRAAFVANPANGSMTDPNAASRQFAVAVAPGTLATRAAGAGAGAVALPPVPDERQLVRPAIAGSTRIDVDRAQNLQALPAPPAPLANRLLLIEPGDPAVSEYQTISTLQLAGAPEEPAQVGLELPLLRSHGEGTRAARINAALPLPATTQVLLDSTAPGDRCVFLDGLGGFLPAPPPVLPPPPGTLRLTGGGAADEFQRFAHLSVRSDGNGLFRLPPVQRMAHVRLTVDDGGNVMTLDADPEYGEPEHQLDAVYLV